MGIALIILFSGLWMFAGLIPALLVVGGLLLLGLLLTLAGG